MRSRVIFILELILESINNVESSIFFCSSSPIQIIKKKKWCLFIISYIHLYSFIFSLSKIFLYRETKHLTE